MFHCAGGSLRCHLVEPGRKMTRVPTVVRIVLNEHIKKDPVTGRTKCTHTSIGQETVLEEKFCPAHMAEARNRKPTIIGSDNNPDMIRTHTIIERFDHYRSPHLLR